MPVNQGRAVLQRFFSGQLLSIRITKLSGKHMAPERVESRWLLSSICNSPCTARCAEIRTIGATPASCAVTPRRSSIAQTGNYFRLGPTHANSAWVSFRPQGEISPRSRAFTDGIGRSGLPPWRLCGRYAEPYSCALCGSAAREPPGWLPRLKMRHDLLGADF
mgnify:CR=1 FL=1